jgi:RND family efflux transporter MFP subunit
MKTREAAGLRRGEVSEPEHPARAAPGIDAVLHVAEIPDRAFPGNVTRTANALAPGTRGIGRRILMVASVLLLGAALGIGYWRHYAPHAQVMATAQRTEKPILEVRTALARANPSIISVRLPAITQAFAQANIYARASGYITRREVDIGSQIKTGQLLVTITAQEVEHQIAQGEGTLASFQAALQQATANRDLAHDTWSRDSRLVQQGDLSQQQGDTDRLNFEALSAAVAVATANIEAQTAQLDVLRQQKVYQSVLAPFIGIVTQRNVDVGDLVQADATSSTFLFTVMQTDTIRIQLYVPQDEAFGVVPGVEAMLHVPEIPDRTFPGTVTRTANALQLDTRTLLTEVDVTNPDQVLWPGLYCTVELRIPRKTPSLIVPSDAVIFNRNGLSVAVVEDGIARIRPVNVVRDFGRTVEVNRGIKDGDQVILTPPVDLIDGRKVTIRPAPPGQLS